MGRLMWVSVGLMAVGLFALIWSGTRSSSSAKAGSLALAQLNAASDPEAVTLLEQIASWGEAGIPLLVESLISQDMFLAGTIVLLLGVLTVIGTFISDLVLMWVDPRLRRELD